MRRSAGRTEALDKAVALVGSQRYRRIFREAQEGRQIVRKVTVFAVYNSSKAPAGSV
jgi:hypothetical protein